MDSTERAFRLYMQGWTLRKLERHFGIPKETIGHRFRSRYGKNYRLIKNFLPVVKEYLSGKYLSKGEKESVQEWMTSSSLFSRLIETKTDSHTKLYTSKEIDNLTRQQCCHLDKDWRDIFTVVEFRQ